MIRRAEKNLAPTIKFAVHIYVTEATKLEESLPPSESTTEVVTFLREVDTGIDDYNAVLSDKYVALSRVA